MNLRMSILPSVINNAATDKKPIAMGIDKPSIGVLLWIVLNSLRCKQFVHLSE